MIAWGVGKFLFEAEVALGGLDRGMSQRKLNLLERSVAAVGEFGKRPAGVGRAARRGCRASRYTAPPLRRSIARSCSCRRAAPLCSPAA